MVFEACPRLERLQLCGGRISSLSLLEKCYESDGCHLQDLAIASVTLDDASDTSLFSETLGDVTHPMARSLQELKLMGCVIHTKMPKIIPAIQKAMVTNRVLHTLRLDVEAPVQTVQRYYEPTDRNRVKIVQKLDGVHKAAFLSVVRQLDHAKMLGSNDVGLIFQYAAVARWRFVQAVIRPPKVCCQ